MYTYLLRLLQKESDLGKISIDVDLTKETIH